MRVLEFERRLTRVLEFALAAGMLAMFLIIIVLVTMRYLFQSGLVGANETATVVFVYLSSLGAAVSVGREEHIRLDILPRKLGSRGKQVADIVALLLVGALNALLAERSLTWIAKTGHTLMPATQVPRIAVQAAVPLGCLLAVAYCGTRIVSKLREGSEA